MDATTMFIYLSHAHICSDICWFLVHGEPPLILCTHVHATIDSYNFLHIYSLLRATPINLLLLQDFESTILAVFKGILFFKVHVADLRIAYKKPFPPL